MRMRVTCKLAGGTPTHHSACVVRRPASTNGVPSPKPPESGAARCRSAVPPTRHQHHGRAHARRTDSAQPARLAVDPVGDRPKAMAGQPTQRVSASSRRRGRAADGGAIGGPDDPRTAIRRGGPPPRPGQGPEDPAGGHTRGGGERPQSWRRRQRCGSGTPGGRGTAACEPRRTAPARAGPGQAQPPDRVKMLPQMGGGNGCPEPGRTEAALAGRQAAAVSSPPARTPPSAARTARHRPGTPPASRSSAHIAGPARRGARSSRPPSPRPNCPPPRR